MCLRYVRIENSNPCGVTSAFVPCGYCVDCRRKVQQAWRFRLVSEAATLKKRGWNIAFATLTYRDECLPHIPEECFKNPADFREIPCFNRSHVVDFIQGVRNYVKHKYRFVGNDRIRYFVASEYGSLRHRPHHHFILAWPPVMPYEEMHKVCAEHWPHGFMFPRDFRGDGKCLSFEVVGDPSKVLQYVSKYACKDIDYYNETKDLKFYDTADYEEGTPEYKIAQLYRNCRPFHVQSRSLGFESIKNMSFEEKRDVYVNGLGFFGDGEMYQVPLYIKNKLIFDNYYILGEDGERLCRRKASAFFDRYKSEIFEEKSKFYTSLIVASSSKEYFTRRGVSDDVAEKFSKRISFWKSIVDSRIQSSDVNLIGKLFLAYHDVVSCTIDSLDLPLVDKWFMRYKTSDELDAIYATTPRIDCSYPLGLLRSYFEYVASANTYVGISCVGEREEQDTRLRKIRDFFNNQLR